MDILHFKVISRMLANVQQWSNSQLPGLAEAHYNSSKSPIDKPFPGVVDQVRKRLFLHYQATGGLHSTTAVSWKISSRALKVIVCWGFVFCKIDSSGSLCML
jgi:hypothetical protein